MKKLLITTCAFALLFSVEANAATKKQINEKADNNAASIVELQNKDKNLQTQINVQASASEQRDNTLLNITKSNENNINSNTNWIGKVESALNTAVDNGKKALGVETQERKDADEVLKKQINGQAAASEQRDNVLLDRTNANAQGIADNKQGIADTNVRVDANAQNINTNATNINTNATNINTNANNIADNTSDIKANSIADAISDAASKARDFVLGLGIAKNAGDIKANEKDIANNVTHIKTNAKDIADNKSNIDNHKTRLDSHDKTLATHNDELFAADGSSNIQTNASNILTNAQISTSEDARIEAKVDQNTWRLDDQQAQINELDHRVNKGLAAVTALTALQPNARSSSNNQVSVGTGYFNGQTAFAVGTFHYLTNETLINTGVSYGGQDSLAVRVGATFGF